jgi:hypothetical protein
MKTFPAARQAAAILPQVRTLHMFIGMLTAPTVLFFAVTGILQIYNLHEARPGYTPPAILEKLSRVHKVQVFALRRPRGQQLHAEQAKSSAAGLCASSAAGTQEHRNPSAAIVLLKLYFTIAAVGLVFSTLLGAWMGLRPGVRRRVNLLLLGAGILIPVVLAAFTA